MSTFVFGGRKFVLRIRQESGFKMLGFLCSKHSRDRTQGVFYFRMGIKMVAFPSHRKHLTSSELGGSSFSIPPWLLAIFIRSFKKTRPLCEVMHLL